MSVLGKRDLVEALSKPDLKERLIVTPLLQDSQIGPGSIDIRLGSEFIVTHRGNLPFFDSSGGKADLTNKRRFEYKHYLQRNQKFYLHPNELVLAASLEYFRLPKNLAGYVTSRSKWGRAGLVIATAVAVHPGFTGTVTLELVNVGEVPLALSPGLKVAQFVFSHCTGGEEYSGQFVGQTSPRSGDQDSKRVEDTKDLSFWCPPSR